MAGVKQVLLMIAVVALVGCGGGKQEETQGPSQPEPATPPQTTEKPKPPKTSPTKLITDPIVEKAIRESPARYRLARSFPEGELTEADLANVTHLDLSFTRITDAGLKDIAKLQKLELLDLVYCEQITAVGLKEVAKLQNLTRLYLNRTKITDAGLKEVAKLQQLRGISLTNTKITDAGVAELRKALPKCNIFR